MLEWCTRPRMLLLLGLLLICTIFIFFYGEYVEENLGTNKFFRRQQPSPASATGSPTNGGMPGPAALQLEICPKSNSTSIGATEEEPLLVQSCQKCSDFERNALQTEHCSISGYFDVYACPGLNGTTTVYRPCLTKMANNESSNFFLFSMFSFICTAAAWQFVQWRKEFLERRAFGSSAVAFQRLGTNGGE